MDWKHQLQGLRGLRKPDKPKKPALLVIDIQKYFCTPDAPAYNPRFEAIIPQVQKLIDYFDKANLPIFATRYYSSSKQDPVARWWNTALPKDSEWFDIDSRLKFKNVTMLDKDLYGTFSSTDIDEELVNAGCDSVVICGVMTDLCCETTAREAFQEGYNVLFAADGTATGSDLLHIGTLATLAHGFAYIIDTDNIINFIGGRK